jgi:hypothetical protein
VVNVAAGEATTDTAADEIFWNLQRTSDCQHGGTPAIFSLLYFSTLFFTFFFLVSFISPIPSQLSFKTEHTINAKVYQSHGLCTKETRRLGEIHHNQKAFQKNYYVYSGIPVLFNKRSTMYFKKKNSFKTYQQYSNY